MLLAGLLPAGGASASEAVRSGASAAMSRVALAVALPKPTITAAGGSHSLAVSWAKVPGARRYTVEYSTKSTFTGAKRIAVGASKTHRIVKGLRDDVPYYVRVRAIALATGNNSVSSAKKVTPDSGYPSELSITVTPAGIDKVKVSWTGQARATKVGVLAGSDSVVTRNLFRSGWYPATTTSITLTVPAHLREEMGTGSGNPVHVKVATYNSLTAGDSMPTAKNISTAYRLSPAGSYGFSAAQTPTGEPLRVATWNVRSAGSSAMMTGYAWKDRRLKVRDNILASEAALLGLQEINTADAGLGNGKRQWEDLLDLLAPSGYAIANLPSSFKLRSDATNGAHLYYKTSDLQVLDGGFVSPRGTGVSWPSEIKDRLWSWAKFRVVRTGATFYAASAHLPVDEDGNDRSKVRVDVAMAMDAFLSARAGAVPIVILGDLNNTILKSGTGPDHSLRVAGYYDAASAIKRYNHHYATVNHVHQLDNLQAAGYPFTPYRAPHVGARIDYIMTKNAPGAATYSNQLIRTPTGEFDPAYQGSDHNLQWADIGIPGPG